MKIRLKILKMRKNKPRKRIFHGTEKQEGQPGNIPAAFSHVKAEVLSERRFYCI